MECAVDRGWFFCTYMPIVSDHLWKSLSLLQTGAGGCVGDFALSLEHPCWNTHVFSGFSAVFHWSASLSFYRFHNLDFCSSIRTWFPQLCSAFSKLFSLYFWPFHTNLRISSSISPSIPAGTVTGMAWTPQASSERTDIVTTMFPGQEQVALPFM